MTRLTGLAFVAALLGPQPCRAQTTLEWEFDEVTYVEVRHVAKQQITVLGRTEETDTQVRFLFKFRPTKVGRAATSLEVTVLACEDSSVSTRNGTEKDDLKGFRNQKFRLTTAAGNQRVDLAVPKELVEAVFGDEAKNGTDDERKFAADMAEMILRVHLLDVFVPLPGRPVAAGDKWRNTAEVKCQPLAQVSIAREYVLAGRQVHEGKRLDVLTWTSQVELRPLRDEKGVLPFSVKELKPVGKPQNDGTVLWDSTANRPVRIDCLQTYETDMVLEADGRTIKGKGKGTDSFVIRFFAKNPDEK